MLKVIYKLLLLTLFILAGKNSLLCQLEITFCPMTFNPITDNRAIDEQMIRYMSRYMSPFVIRGVENSLQKAKWNDPKGYWDSTIFAKMKQFNPQVITAFYTKLEDYSTTNDTTFDIETLHGMDSLGVPELIADPKHHTKPMITKSDFMYGDARNSAFRNWMIGRIDTTFHQKVKTTGFQFDRTWIDPVTRFFPAPYNTDTAFINSYTDSNYTFMQQVRLAFPHAYIQLNGISPETYVQQTRLLDFADAENVEAFGIAESGDTIFETAVLPYIKMMDSAAFANKRFNMFGSGHGSYASVDSYKTYAEEKQFERYEFGCFLLGANDKSEFHFRTGSGYPTMQEGRFSVLDLHSDYIYNRLGKATNHYQQKNNGLYTRNFKNGFTVVAPITKDAKLYTYNLHGMVYDNEGNSYKDSVHLRSGQAFILYYNLQPRLPCKYEINFEDTLDVANFIAAGMKDLPKASIKVENNNHYISFGSLVNTQYEEFEHDIMLDWVRYQQKDSLFTFTYRTTSAKASIQLFCEVDDTSTHQYYNAVINFSVSAENKKLTDNYAYRTFMYATNQPEKIPDVQSSTRLINDNNWHTITINGTELLKAGVKFIRPHYMRVNREIDFDDIIVYHTSCMENFPVALNK